MDRAPPDALPQTLAELARYPIAYRRAIDGKLAPSVREAMWREHLEDFLGAETTLTPVQQAVVRDLDVGQAETRSTVFTKS